jgi:hypothetical protein
VNGDSVVLSPPHPNAAGELKKIEKQYRDRNLKPAQRKKLDKRRNDLSTIVYRSIKETVKLSLAALRKDSDGDGLPNLVEKRFGTDPNNADTDGDGVRDDRDANPLGKPAPPGLDRAQLFQTAFTAVFGRETSFEPIIVLLDKPYWQEFTGARARVICMTEEAYLDNAQHLGSLRVLEFGGPGDDSATILVRDGPALFNDSRTKGEVHFWSWRPDTQDRYGYSRGTSQVPTEYVAKFERTDGWRLVSAKPSNVITADLAIAKYNMRKQQQRGDSYGMPGGMTE